MNLFNWEQTLVIGVLWNLIAQQPKEKQGNNYVGFIGDYGDPLIRMLLNKICDSHYVI